MSASTHAITASPAVNNNNNPSVVIGSRRRTVSSVIEKKSPNIEMVAEGGGGIGGSEQIGGDGRDLSHTIRGDSSLDRDRTMNSLQAKKGLTNSTVSPRRRKVIVKAPVKPMWKTILSVFLKNFMLLLILLGLVQMIRKLAMKSGSDGISPLGYSEIEGRIQEVEAFMRTTTKMMQVQVDVMDKKIGSEVGSLKRELTKKVEEKDLIFETELKKLEAKSEYLDKSLSEFKANGYFTKEDFERFVDELKKKKPEESDKDWSLDEIRSFAKDIVEKEIEKHAADGLGMVDFALASGGGIVFAHSDPYIHPKGSTWYKLKKQVQGIHPDAQKMLEPSFGQPGQCFALQGSSGFVKIKLRTAIIPEAITLEHVSKSVAYDRSSAPKNCRVSAWYQKRDIPGDQSSEAEILTLSEFVYDLDRSNAQTFNVESANLGFVNMITFEFLSNYGAAHTCVYRLRVHGRAADAGELAKLEA